MTDYTFYTTMYLCGREAVLSASSFTHWEHKASRVVNNMTFGNIKYLDDIPDDVKMCVCEVAELLYRQDEDRRSNGGIASESVGGHSVTYSTKTKQDEIREIGNIVSSWLAESGLTYCGGRCAT